METIWTPVESVPDMLGIPVQRGTILAYPGKDTMRISYVLAVFDGGESGQRRPAWLYRAQVLGLDDSYGLWRATPERWTTYHSMVYKLHEALTIHPSYYDDRIVWLRRQALNLKGT